VWSSSPCLSVLFFFIYLTVRNDDGDDYRAGPDVCLPVFRLVCCRINCIIVGKEKPGDGLALAGRQIKGKTQQKKGLNARVIRPSSRRLCLLFLFSFFFRFRVIWPGPAMASARVYCVPH
jgi:hypothetical protein